MRLRPLSVLMLIWLTILAPSAGAADLEVEATDNLFTPASLTASVGDTVTFTNAGQAPHNVQFDDDSQQGIDILNPGQSRTITLSKAGTFPYVCSFHPPDMRGTITVTGAGEATGETGPTATPAAQETSEAASVTEESPAADPATDEAELVAADKPPSEKYFPAAGFGLFVLLLVLIGIGFLRYTMKSAETRR